MRAAPGSRLSALRAAAGMTREWDMKTLLPLREKVARAAGRMRGFSADRPRGDGWARAV